jgi:hypothetical protein
VLSFFAKGIAPVGVDKSVLMKHPKKIGTAYKMGIVPFAYLEHPAKWGQQFALHELPENRGRQKA